jgi:hypothetical protein
MLPLISVVCPCCNGEVYLASSKRGQVEPYCKCLNYKCNWFGRVKDAKVKDYNNGKY